ncbi:hypothetical protein [Azospirillum sp. Sh1]|uniref:hypothetical protein n=1 Tax=Azospirillum sp. Sh1 TaxID=2607285 RepID=UPI0011ECD3B2|nr:hypothetical protein [Azospirillum sp. Sh1]KAA0573470.1 hypothetical protein FZ029_21065 [Azospirillum sp. Sh1]
MILAVTGHRPEKLGGHSPALRRKLAVFASFRLRHFIQTHGRPDKIISGMALGWDQAMAIAAIAAGIPLVAAVPCDAQDAT